MRNKKNLHKTKVAFALIAFLCASICLAQPQGPVTVTGLELSADKTDIECPPIKFNEKFSPATLDYTVTVDQSYTQYVFIAPRLSPAEYGSSRINGADVKPGEPYKVKLNPGENRFSVTLASNGGVAATAYQLTVTQKDLSKEYWPEPLGKGMWRIQDFGGCIGNEDMYLIEGKDRAIPFDTGMGRGNLAAYVRSLPVCLLMSPSIAALRAMTAEPILEATAKPNHPQEGKSEWVRPAELAGIQQQRWLSDHAPGRGIARRARKGPCALPVSGSLLRQALNALLRSSGSASVMGTEERKDTP